MARIYARYARSRVQRRRWNAVNPGNAAIRGELVESVFALADRELRSAGAILDVGCGTGWWLARLAADDRVSGALHGIELLPERATAASARTPTAAIEVGDARSLPYEARTFAIVTLFTVLSSLSEGEDVRRALREARRVLAPGGVVLIWEPRVSNPLNRRTVFVSRALLRDALRGMEVQARTTTVVPALARRLNARTEALYPRLARLRLLSTHRLVRARAR